MFGVWISACLVFGFLAWLTSTPSRSPEEAHAGVSTMPVTTSAPRKTTPLAQRRTTTPAVNTTTSTGQTVAAATPLVTKVPPGAKLEQTVQDVIGRWKDQLGPNVEYGLVIHNLDTGDKVSINGHNNYETASVYKLFVMLSVFYDISQGNLALDTPITLIPDAQDADEDGGAILQVGQSLPVRDLLDAMITRSNNTAALMLLFQVKTPRFQKIIADLGFKESDLHDSYNFQATSEDLDLFLSRLANGKLLDPQSDQAMLDLMSRSAIRDRIPALLPPGTKVANKTGNLGLIANDTGIVFLPNGQKLAITVMVRNFNGAGDAYKFISELSLAAYNFYVPAT